METTTLRSLVLSIALTLLLVLAAAEASAQGKLPPPELPELSAPPYGTTSYSLTLGELDGGQVALSRFKGKVIFLHYWATYCGSCVAELPALQRLRDGLRDRDDIVFLAVSKDQDTAMVSEFLKKRSLNLPVYMRIENSEEFPPGGIPVTFVVERKGTVRFRHSGPVNWDHPSAKAYLLAVAGERGER